VYATAGVLAVQLRQQDDAEIMGRYRFILVDEAHERSLDSDITLMLLRNFYIRNAGNERLPFLLLTSATFDPARYAEYFGVSADNIIEVAGRSYPITTHWPEQGTNDYATTAAASVISIHESNPDDPPARADIMVFMPGAAEMKVVSDLLWAANKKYIQSGRRDEPREERHAGGGRAGSSHAGNSHAESGRAGNSHAESGRAGNSHAESGRAEQATAGPLLILNINREVVIAQTGDFEYLTLPPDELPDIGGQRPARRVIVTTIVAETGLTIDTLKYVVDCGWSRTREIYQPWDAEGIITRPAPQNRIEQRRGRAGRLFPGEFYPLYTENVYRALDAQQLPDIITVGPAGVLLALAREQQRQRLREGRAPEFRIEDLTLLDPPPPEAFLAANAAATALGFMSLRASLPAAWPPVMLTQAVSAEPDRGVLAQARGCGLTATGHLGAMFARATMEAVRVLLAGYVWGAAASDLLTAVAMFGTAPEDLLTAKERRKKVSSSTLPPGADALRVALPQFLAQRTGGGAGAGPLPPTEAEAFYFRARLLIADDFIESILIYDAFARRLDAEQGSMATLVEWCQGAGLNFDALIELARKRETIIEEMLLVGLNPFRGDAQRLATLQFGQFTDGMVRLKRCLYDGLRCRLLKYDGAHAEGPGYFTQQGLRVATPGLFTDMMADRLRALSVTPADAPTWHPSWLVTDQIRLLPARKRPEDKGPPLLYTAVTNLVSVLDGVVDPDVDFIAPRTFDAPPAGVHARKP
jgi:hypothetical protein